MKILLVALAPVLIIAGYIYFRDKYEREPAWMLIKSLLAGIIIVLPVIYVEIWLSSFKPFIPVSMQAAYDGFIVAASTEEFFKFLAVMIIAWPNKNFNEKFDGIVYASFVSLGFAAAENVSYVYQFGIDVGYMRAITAVPAHALFGIYMGYQLGIAKFYKKQRFYRILAALFIPILFHGFYDWVLMEGFTYYLWVFVPFIVYMWVRGLKRMKKLSDTSIYRNK